MIDYEDDLFYSIAFSSVQDSRNNEPVWLNINLNTKKTNTYNFKHILTPFVYYNIKIYVQGKI